jgi:hypothetical protein
MVSSIDRVSGEITETVSPSEKVVELVLLDGTTFTFDQRGGKLSADTREVIKGTTSRGDTLYVPLKEVWQCRVSPPDTISRADLDTTHITEVVLSNNSLATFEPPGGTYDKKTGAITGAQPLKGRVSYKLDAVRSIRAHRPRVIRPDSLRRNPGQSIYEVIDKKYAVYTFDSTGGHLKGTNGFYGKTKDGVYVEVSPDDVLYAGVERADPSASAAASMGVVAGVVGLLAFIGFAAAGYHPFYW